VSVATGNEECLLSLTEGPRGFDPWEFWVGLAPDDSPLLMRDRSTQEIYSLDVRFPQLVGLCSTFEHSIERRDLVPLAIKTRA
jgi:hypothetical protein